MPTATVRRGVAASDDRKRDAAQCELRGRGLLNDDSGRLRRKDSAMVYMTTVALSQPVLRERETGDPPMRRLYGVKVSTL